MVIREEVIREEVIKGAGTATEEVITEVGMEMKGVIKAELIKEVGMATEEDIKVEDTGMEMATKVEVIKEVIREEAMGTEEGIKAVIREEVIKEVGMATERVIREEGMVTEEVIKAAAMDITKINFAMTDVTEKAAEEFGRLRKKRCATCPATRNLVRFLLLDKWDGQDPGTELANFEHYLLGYSRTFQLQNFLEIKLDYTLPVCIDSVLSSRSVFVPDTLFIS